MAFTDECESLIREYYVASRQVRVEAGANLPVSAVKTMYVVCDVCNIANRRFFTGMSLKLVQCTSPVPPLISCHLHMYMVPYAFI